MRLFIIVSQSLQHQSTRIGVDARDGAETVSITRSEHRISRRFVRLVIIMNGYVDVVIDADADSRHFDRSQRGAYEHTVSTTARKIMERERTQQLKATAGLLQELRSKLKMMSYSGVGGQDAMTLFRRYDKGTGSITFDDFSAAVRKDGKMSRNKLSDIKLGQLFDALDTHNAGVITLEALESFVWARKPLGQVNGNSTPTPRGRKSKLVARTESFAEARIHENDSTHS